MGVDTLISYGTEDILILLKKTKVSFQFFRTTKLIKFGHF